MLTISSSDIAAAPTFQAPISCAVFGEDGAVVASDTFGCVAVDVEAFGGDDDFGLEDLGDDGLEALGDDAVLEAGDGAIPGEVEPTGPGTGTPYEAQRLGSGVVTLQSTGSSIACEMLMPIGTVKVVL